MANSNERVISGVKTRTLHGKDYVEVAERINSVYKQNKEFEVVESVPFEIAGRLVWRVVIMVEGKQRVGNAEVKLDAPKNTPDGTNPFECAETSAMGRALGFAGFGSVERIASYDEVVRGEANADDPLAEQIAELKDRCEMLFGSGKWNNVKFRLFNASIPDGKLTSEQVDQLTAKFDSVEAKRASASDVA